jgi:hypothetical protein
MTALNEGVPALPWGRQLLWGPEDDDIAPLWEG